MGARKSNKFHKKQINTNKILLIILVLVITLCGFLFEKYLKLQQQIISSQKTYYQHPISQVLVPTLQPLGSINPSTTKKVITTNESLWKTYINKDYHFSFKYPPEFTITESKHVTNYQNFSHEPVSHTDYELSFSTGEEIWDGTNYSPDRDGFAVRVEPTNGRTISQEYTGQPGLGGVVGTTFLSNTGGADEAADLTNIENGYRVYRVGSNFFEVGTFQNNLVLSDGSDDVMNYFEQIINTLQFPR